MGAGKRTLVEQVYDDDAAPPAQAVQARGALAGEPREVQRVAAAGVDGAGAPLPHLETIQRAFGPHDLSGVRAQVGGTAATASEAIHADAYATGDRIAFRTAPDLHTAAHEAAHVVQQRAGVQLAGGVGHTGDAYEQQADAVADRVVRGESASELLGDAGQGRAASTAVQRQDATGATEGTEQARWIATLYDGAKVRDGASKSHAILLDFAHYNAPLYYVGHWKNDEANEPYDPPDSDPAYPLRWLEVQFQHPDWPTAVRGWVHSGVTHYPHRIEQPTADALRNVSVTASASAGVPSTPVGTPNPAAGTPNPAAGTPNPAAGTPNPAAGTANPGVGQVPVATGSGNTPPLGLQEPVLEPDIREGALVIVGGGLSVPYVADATPLAMLAATPRIQPFIVGGQGNGTTFHRSPNVRDVALDSRMDAVIPVIGIIRGRLADYVTWEYRNSDSGTVRRSEIWLICEQEGGTYFVHAGATDTDDTQLADALGVARAAPAAPSTAPGNAAPGNAEQPSYDDWIEQGDHLAALPETPTPELAAYQMSHGFAPGELIPSGYLPAGSTVSATTSQAAVALRVAPVSTAHHIRLLPVGESVALYGMLPDPTEAWFRARATVDGVATYGWISVRHLNDAATLTRTFAPSLQLATSPTTGTTTPLPGVGTIHVTSSTGADALSSPSGGMLVAHLEPGFAITHVYEVVVGQAIARPRGMSTQWLRIGLSRESAPAEVTAYLPVLDTSFQPTTAPTSGGGGAELTVTVINPNVYVYSAPGFNRDLQLIDAALPIGHPLSVQWATSVDGASWLHVRTDTAVGTIEGYVAATRTSYTGGAPGAPVRRIQSSQAGSGSGGTQTTITQDETRIRPNASAGPSDAVLGYLDDGATVSVLLQFETNDPEGVVTTELARSSSWLYIEIPASTPVHDSAGTALANPPRRGWIHQSSTDLQGGGGGGEAHSGPPTNEGADQLAMPGTPPAEISSELRFRMSGPEVQQAKVKLVQRRYMNMSEYRARGESFYSNWTTEAVRSFQLHAMPTTGLQDGVLWPHVWRALFASATQQAHMTRTEIEGMLSGIASSYQWDDRVNNVYAYANYGSSSFWGADLPGGECTWFVRSVLTRLPFRLGAGTWAAEARTQGLVLSAPTSGCVMNLGTHLAIVTGVHGEGAATTIDVIESNWNYSRSVGTRSGLPVTPDMVFIRQP